MIPPWTTTFRLISTFNPLPSFFNLSTNTFVKVIILIFMLFNYWFLLFFGWGLLLLSLNRWWLFDILGLDIFEHDSLETEGVEESPFCQWLNLLWIDSTNRECPLTHVDNFVIFRNLRDLLMGLCNRLRNKLTKITYKNRFSSNIVAIDYLIFSNYSFIAGVDLICFNSYYFSCYWTIRPNLRNARLSYLLISVDIFSIAMCAMLCLILIYISLYMFFDLLKMVGIYEKFRF